MIDSERVTFEGYVKELKKMNLTISEEFYKGFLGMQLKPMFESFKKKYGNDFPMQDVLTNVHAYVAKQFEKDGVPLKKGLKALLSYLRENNYKTMIATSSTRDRLDLILKQADLSSYFDASICGDEIEKGKPNPAVFLKSCEKLGVKPEDALVLEDSEAGIQAAYDAGIKVICVPDMKYPAPEYAAKAHDIVDSLETVLELLRD